jgi:hypothetical protein
MLGERKRSIQWSSCIEETDTSHVPERRNSIRRNSQSAKDDPRRNSLKREFTVDPHEGRSAKDARDAALRGSRKVSIQVQAAPEELPKMDAHLSTREAHLAGKFVDKLAGVDQFTRGSLNRNQSQRVTRRTMRRNKTRSGIKAELR